jgi:hypothetical protein
MRPQVAAVVAAAGVVARNQFTNISKKSRSFLRLFFVQTDSFMQVLGTDTYFGKIPTPKSEWRTCQSNRWQAK